jgi:large subunit ribosomal protein L15
VKLNQLKPAPGSKKRRKRVGRGYGSGHGVTATRGTKGQKARSGGGKGAYFEGGQNPLHLRLPRYPGFKNIFKEKFTVVNVEKLNIFPNGSVVDREALVKKGLVNKSEKRIKILGRGDLEKKVTVKVAAVSQKAQEKIEKAGGKVELVK